MFIDSNKIGLELDTSALTDHKTIKFPDVTITKGIIFTSDGDDQLQYLTSNGQDGKLLMVDSSEPTGLKWANAVESGITPNPLILANDGTTDYVNTPTLTWEGVNGTGIYYDNTYYGWIYPQHGIGFSIDGDKKLSLNTLIDTNVTYLHLHEDPMTGWSDYFDTGDDKHLITKGELDSKIGWEFTPTNINEIVTTDNTPTIFFDAFKNQARYFEVHVIGWTHADGPKAIVSGIIKVINQSLPTDEVISSVEIFAGTGMEACNISVSDHYIMVTGPSGTLMKWKGWYQTIGI